MEPRDPIWMNLMYMDFVEIRREVVLTIFFSLSLDTRDKYQPIFRIYELVLTKYPGYWPLIIIHPEITNII